MEPRCVLSFNVKGFLEFFYDTLIFKTYYGNILFFCPVGALDIFKELPHEFVSSSDLQEVVKSGDRHTIYGLRYQNYFECLHKRIFIPKIYQVDLHAHVLILWIHIYSNFNVDLRLTCLLSHAAMKKNKKNQEKSPLKKNKK